MENNDNIRIVEINGIKLEVDLRTAKKIENYRVGDAVKVLVKTYSDYVSYPGVIIGFDEFLNLPTIIIAYLEADYSTAKIKFAYINSQTKDKEMCMANTKEIPFNKDRVVEMINNEIEKSILATEEIKRKKEFFLSEFGMYFDGVKMPVGEGV